MSYSLTAHENGYRISFSQGLISLATGVSGVLYAKRHWSLANKDREHCYGHRTIAVFEALPVIGGVISIFERVSVLVQERIFNHSNRINNIPDSSFTEFSDLRQDFQLDYTDKMKKNFEKAINEHKIGCDSNSYADIDEINWSLELQTVQPLKYKAGYFEERGVRRTMEDAYCYIEDEKHVLMGIFDGHGGREVAQIASRNFPKLFFNELNKNKKNVRVSFEEVINQIQKFLVGESTAHNKYRTMGSTIVICYIDKETNNIYTATLGDSEANIYREIFGGIKSIPLSCVRDWTSPKDVRRAAEALEDENIIQVWPQYDRDMRKVHCRVGFDRNTGPYWKVNLSRAIGDIDITFSPKGKPGIIHKPKITVHRVIEGDIIVLSCDGFRDFVTEREVVDIISENRTEEPENISQSLVDFAYFYKESDDNISVMAIKVGR